MRIRLTGALTLCSALAFADFSYQQTSKVTGGAMAGMMRVAGAFSKAARDGQVSTVMLQGNKLANVMGNRVHIIDLDSETMTDVDLEKKTYATITFAQMADAIRRMGEKMGQTRTDANLQMTADVKNTGATRVIHGMNTKQAILTLTMEGTDTKSGQTGAMNVAMEMWMAPEILGYGEVKAFYARMAQKMAWNPTIAAMGPMMAQHGKSMAELAKEMSKLEGLPVLQITRLGGSGDGMPSEAQVAQAQQQQPSAQEAATTAAAGSALGRMGRVGSLAGGLGGFGRRKKTEPEQAPAATEQPRPAQTEAAPQNAGLLMEFTTELSSFSSSVDASKLQVPAGFKQVEHDMVKALR